VIYSSIASSLQSRQALKPFAPWIAAATWTMNPGSKVRVPSNEVKDVWRSVFMALGFTAMFLGVECFVIERVEFSPSFSSLVSGRDSSRITSSSPNNYSVFQNSAYQGMSANAANVPGRIFRPREWMPWSLLAVGALIVMYTGAHGAKPA
jgi:hypothetical protein